MNLGVYMIKSYVVWCTALMFAQITLCCALAPEKKERYQTVMFDPATMQTAEQLPLRAMVQEGCKGFLIVNYSVSKSQPEKQRYFIQQFTKADSSEWKACARGFYCAGLTPDMYEQLISFLRNRT